jgi:hypothetical protein
VVDKIMSLWSTLRNMKKEIHIKEKEKSENKKEKEV